IGTLRAIGWSRGRVVRQIVAETVGIGLVAGALGIALGFGASAAVTALSPALSANTVGVSTFQGSSLAGLFGQSTQAVTTSSTIHLTVPIHPLTLIVGVALAVLGAIEGPSGSGKSTMLQLLGALDKPSRGNVVFDGRDLSKLDDAELTSIRARDIGFVFQAFNLIPTLTASENIEIAMVPLKEGKAERRQ